MASRLTEIAMRFMEALATGTVRGRPGRGSVAELARVKVAIQLIWTRASRLQFEVKRPGPLEAMLATQCG